jgi:hypothetical protein
MRKLLVGTLVVGLCLCMGSAFAGYTNITIPDLEGTGTGWYGAQEDNEVEPNCLTGQAWDLEAFMLDDTTLTMVGGWNFQGSLDGWASGDLFIDLGSETQPLDSQYGPAAVNIPRDDNNNSVNRNFLYDIVLDVDWATGNYTAYTLYNTSVVALSEVYYGQNEESNPYRYVGGGSSAIATGTFSFGAWDNSETNFAGATHNAATVDLSWLDMLFPTYDPNATWEAEARFHFTQGCGNDNLMGEGAFGGEPTPPNTPEPATLVLMGLSLVGLAARRQVMRFF